MFDCPEHALAVAFAITELPIEPKSATLLIIEALEARFGVGKVKLPTGLSPHDWHAQAVMTLSFTEKALASAPILWAAVVAEYSSGVRGARAIQEVSSYLVPKAESTERLVTDYLIMRTFRRKPSLRDIADHFGLSASTIGRKERAMHPAINQLRQRAMDMLRDPMEESGLVLSTTTVS
jgi:hypothetical protein